MERSTINLLRVVVVFLTFVVVLRGNQLPELVPYQIVPLDPIPGFQPKQTSRYV